MIPRWLRACVKIVLELAIVFTFVLSTPTMKQCKRKNIPNLGLKLCQLKCNENNLCSDFEYHIETLPCRLSRNESKKTENQEPHGSISRNPSNVLTGSCESKTCRPGQRCLEIRSRKAICQRDEKGNNPPKQKVDKQDSNSSLHNACRKGDLTRVKRILSRGLIDINSRDKKNGRTPLMVAANEGHCRILSFLVSKGANMSHVDNGGKNILHWAYEGGHVNMVECVLLQFGVNIHDNQPQILQVAKSGQGDVLEFLLCMGANVYQVDRHGRNVLHYACIFGHVSVVTYVLSQGGLDINGRDKGGATPLILSEKHGHRDICEFLVCMGANLSHVDKQNNNVLHYASRAGHMKIVKYILSKDKVDVNSRGRAGWTPLIIAAYFGRIKVFDQLVRKGGLTRLVDDSGNNILHLASLRGHVNMVKHILSEDMVDLNARNKNGETAAMMAKRYRKRRVYDLLVSRGHPVK